MIKNVLAAVLACTIHQIDSHSLAKALQGFKLSPETTPGRMNLFNFKNFKVLIDYAHNADAFLNLKDYIEKNAYAKKIGIIAATGNRRDEDIINVGKQAAEIFDEIIIRHDKDSRGRTNEILTALLMQGIQSVEKATQVEIISDEFDAIDAALEKATKDSIIFYFPDDIFKAINYVKEKAEKSAHPAKKFPFLREA